MQLFCSWSCLCLATEPGQFSANKSSLPCCFYLCLQWKRVLSPEKVVFFLNIFVVGAISWIYLCCFCIVCWTDSSDLLIKCWSKFSFKQNQGWFYTDLTVSSVMSDRILQSERGPTLLGHVYDPLLTSLNSRQTGSQMKKMGHSEEVCLSWRTKLSGQC